MRAVSSYFSPPLILKKLLCGFFIREYLKEFIKADFLPLFSLGVLLSIMPIIIPDYAGMSRG